MAPLLGLNLLLGYRNYYPYIEFVYIRTHPNQVQHKCSSLAADPHSPDDVMQAALRGRQGEGLSNIVIHSFQLTNQIRNEYSCSKSGQLYS